MKNKKKKNTTQTKKQTKQKRKRKCHHRHQRHHLRHCRRHRPRREPARHRRGHQAGTGIIQVNALRAPGCLRTQPRYLIHQKCQFPSARHHDCHSEAFASRSGRGRGTCCRFSAPHLVVAPRRELLLRQRLRNHRSVKSPILYENFAGFVAADDDAGEIDAGHVAFVCFGIHRGAV